MKTIFKNCKKGGMLGAKSKFNLKIMMLASFLLFAVGFMCFASGSIEGMMTGIMLASAPIIGFVMPEGLNDNEKKGIESVLKYVNEKIAERPDGMSQEDVSKIVKESINTHFGDVGPDKIKEIQKALETQGLEIAKIKKGAPHEDLSLNAAIQKVLNSEEFKEALKSGVLDSRQGKTFELETKASLADVTAPVTMTQMKPGVNMGRDRQLAFIPALAQGIIGQDNHNNRSAIKVTRFIGESG